MTGRCVRAGFAGLVLLLGAAAPVMAQEVRVSVRVEEIAGADVYLSRGNLAGIVVGDTLPAYRDSSAARVGRVVVMTATRRRSVVRIVGTPFPLTRGQELQLGVPPDRIPPPEEPVPARPEAVMEPAVQAPQPARGRIRAMQASGSASFDVDAIASSIEAPAGRTEHQYVTPALRLYFAAVHAPGDLTITAQLRGAQRVESPATARDATSLRVYQASAVKTFQAVPLRVEAGRFSSRYDLYGGYWDGVQFRVGGDRVGVGAAAGYEPELANEGFSAERAKYAAFVDWRVAPGRVQYEGVAAAHMGALLDTTGDRQYVGLSQRLRWRGGGVGQRLRLERGTDAGWTLADVQLDGNLVLAGGVSVRAHYARLRTQDVLEPDVALIRERTRAGGGIAWYGARAGVSADLSHVGTEDGGSTTSQAGTWYVNRPAGLGLGWNGSVTTWETAGTRALYLMQGLSIPLGRARVTAEYSLYRTALGTATTLSSAGAGVTVPVARRVRASLRADHRWGAGTSTLHVRSGIAFGF